MDSIFYELLRDIIEKVSDIFIDNNYINIGTIKATANNSDKDLNLKFILKKNLKIWLLNYQESSDTLFHWILYPYDGNMYYHNEVKKMKIRNGVGTIGFILRSNNGEIVNNTFDDPRGTVSIEDDIVKNYSWFGLPISNRKGVTKLILSFSYPCFNFWNLNEKAKIINITQKFIDDNYKDKLLLFNQIEQITRLNNFFLTNTSVNFFKDILTEVSDAAKDLLFYKAIFLLKKTEKKYKIIHFILNTALFENIIVELLNWCEISKYKCHNNCKMYHKRPNGIQSNCLYERYFLQYIRPYYISNIVIDDKFEWKIFIKKDIIFDSSKIIIILNKIFDPIITIYSETINKKDYTNAKLIRETIISLGNTVTKFLLCKTNFITKEISIENRYVSKFSKATIALLNKLNVKYISVDVSDIKLIEIENNTNDLFKHFNKLKQNVKNDILFIQFWENNSQGIIIDFIKYKGNNYSKVNESYIINNEKICEYGTLNVLRRILLDVEKREDILRNYKPLIVGYKKNRGITVNSTSDLNTIIIHEDDTDAFNIVCKKNNNTSVLHNMIIQSDNLEKHILNNINFNYFLSNFTKTIENEFLDNKMFGNIEIIPLYPNSNFKEDEPFIAIASMRNIFHSDFSRTEIDILGQFCRKLYEGVEKENALIESKKNLDKIAIISILVDSFAHNISAHSLSSVVWLYLKRISELNKRFLNIEPLKRAPLNLKVSDLEKISTKAVHDYDLLGLKDTTHSESSFSLHDVFEFMDENLRSQIFSFEGMPYNIENLDLKDKKPCIPIPIDNELLQLLRYLKNKSAFWNGVTRDIPFGGEILHWYEILYEFSNNPLFLGTIAHSEGINRVVINVGYGKKSKYLTDIWGVKSPKPTRKFLTIDISELMKKDDTTKLCSENQHKKIFPHKYIFLGTHFREIRKNLKSDDFDVFLPGGIVGKHALYTIFENTIRNIKHVKGAVSEIELNIYIDSISDKLFNLHVWLGNESKITQDKIKEMETLLNKPIVTEDGKPILGGSSQDKICASMLYNNVFSKVEYKNITYQNQILYPWIQIEPLNGEKIVKRSFLLWQGELYLSLKNIQNLVDENPGRFKFTLLEDDHSVPPQYISENGLIRVIPKAEAKEKSDDKESRFTEIELYKIWNKKWINIKNNVFCVGIGDTVKCKIIKKNEQWEFLKLTTTKTDGFLIFFFHGEGGESQTNNEKLQYRNHGPLIELFFDSNFNFREKASVGEFVETLLTNIVIFDNRIHNRVFERGNKINLFKNKLFLNIQKERSDEQEESNIKALKEIIHNEEKPNILILHLSYIESLPKKHNSTTKYKETDIHEFVEDYLGNLLGENTKLIITTGRGRGLWWDKLQKEGNHYIQHILFKPIESILAAVEDGLIFKDDFMVKYNLMKVIMGS